MADGDAQNSGRPGPHGGRLRDFPPGVSGNPGGRPKVGRTRSAALAELNDTEGASAAEVVENFIRARGARMCGADHEAVALFLAGMSVMNPSMVRAQEAKADRLEGKVTQPIAAEGTVKLVVYDETAPADVKPGLDEAEDE